MGTLANSKHLAQAKVADAKDTASASVASATAALDGWANHASKLRSTTRSAQMAAGETVSACWASASATQVSLAKTAPNLSNVQGRTVAVTEKANASTENATAPQDSKAKTARSVKSARTVAVRTAYAPMASACAYQVTLVRIAPTRLHAKRTRAKMAYARKAAAFVTMAGPVRHARLR